MQKLKGFLREHRYFFGIFVFTVLYHFVVTGACALWRLSVPAQGYYALDYSIGFSDRILPGAIYNLFVGDFSVRALSVYHTVLLLIFFFVLSIVLERLFLSAGSRNIVFCIIAVLLFLTGPCTFSIFVHYLGMVEFYWVLFALIFFLFLAYRPLQFGVVPLCLLVLLVSVVGIMTFVPFFCILLLYKLSMEKTKIGKRILFCVFLLCVCVSIPFALYLLAQGKNNFAYSFEEVHALLVEKGVVNPAYTEYFLFHRVDYGENMDYLLNDSLVVEYSAVLSGLSGGIKTIVYELLLQIRVVFLMSAHREWSNLLFVGLLTAPVWIAILYYLIQKIRDRTADRLMRFSLFCMIALFFLVIMMGIVMSVEHTKWFSFSFLMLFGGFMYIYFTDGSARQYISRLISSPVRGTIPVYCVLYAFTTFALFD